MKASPALIAALFATGALAFAAPSLAQDAAPAACTAPTPPATPNGATATLEEMQAATAAVKAFIVASDAFQECEVNSVDAAIAAATAAKTKFDNKISKESKARIRANQKQKEAAGAAFSASRKAYLAAHPS